MLFTLLLSLLLLLSSVAPLEAQSLRYRFTLPDNSINLSFTKLIVPSPSAVPSTTITTTNNSIPQALSFTYQLQSAQALPPDLPLALLVYGQQVLFYAQAGQLNLPPEQVLIDLADLSPEESQVLPVFYKNQNLGDFDFLVKEVKWLTSFPKNQQLEVTLKDLTVIREKDQTLTVLFSVLDEFTKQNQYQLVCQSEQGEIARSVTLLKKDDFLWPNLIFQSFTPNHKNELIFQLVDFACPNLVYVIDRVGNRSAAVSIINVEEL